MKIKEFLRKSTAFCKGKTTTLLNINSFPRMLYKNVYRRLSISVSDVKSFYYFTKRHKETDTYITTLFGKRIISFNNCFWFYHSVEELFLEEVYKCNFETSSPRIIDCGSNIGLSVIYFKQSYPNAKITAFEPDPVQYKRLLKNISSFRLENVEAINKGVWKEDAYLKFYPDGNLGGTLIHSDFSNTRNFQNIQVVRLKDYLNNKIDFLKLDIEGAEYDVLLDIRDQLHNIENLFLEYHCYANESQKFDEILRLMKNAGFRYHIKQAWENQKFPFIEKRLTGWDLQLNVYCYRR